MISLRRSVHVLLLCGIILGWTGYEGRAAERENGRLTIARMKYDGGGDWYNDPEAIPNLARELQLRAGIETNPDQRVVTLTDDLLFSSPFLFMTGHGEVRWTEPEIRNLRTYLARGGFLYADDDYGMDEAFRREMKRVFPDKDFVELPFDHPIYHIIYEFPAGPPKHHEHDGKPPQGFGLFHDGRLVVYYTYESNVSDGWADEKTHNDPPAKREAAFRMGINIVAYALYR
ncbi:MAG: DUF4159 domain-containing protein [Gemmatimonadetes bacterium]|nr:DUF4159 domain-containing protein [Gemmatimonadota bacterium]MYH18283.1 DUF4159 domain-containing protein [Gemmatimonadota bacterium]